MLNPVDVALRDRVNEMLDAFSAEELVQAEAPRGRKGTTIVLSLRVLTGTGKYLQKLAQENGWTVTELIRRALRDWLRRYDRMRKAALRRMAGLAEDLSEQARRVFLELPADEITDDEPLHFTVDVGGGVVIRADRTGAEYRLFQGHAVRLRTIENGCGEMVVFRSGEAIEIAQFELADMAAWLDAKERVPPGE